MRDTRLARLAALTVALVAGTGAAAVDTTGAAQAPSTPDNAEARLSIASAYSRDGDVAEAIRELRQAVRLGPDSVPALAALAWLLATAPDGALRDGNEAVRLAERAARLSRRGEPSALDVLAAAYAAAGLFDRALDATQEALALAPPDPLAGEIRRRQDLYRRHQPYREPVQ